MRTRGHIARFAVLTAVLGVNGSWAVSISLDYNLFGHLENLGGRCAATATMNSFIYLKNRYPTVYGGTAIDQGTNPANTHEDARLELADGYIAPSGDHRPGMG
jgi:hypothetical protein